MGTEEAHDGITVHEPHCIAVVLELPNDTLLSCPIEKLCPYSSLIIDGNCHTSQTLLYSSETYDCSSIGNCDEPVGLVEFLSLICLGLKQRTVASIGCDQKVCVCVCVCVCG